MFQTVNSHKRKVWIYRPCHPVNLSVFTLCPCIKYAGLPGYFMLVVKNPPANVGDKRHGFDSWVRKIPWRRAWQPTWYSCLENPMDRGAWQATVHGVAQSQTRLKRLGTYMNTQVWNT